MELAWQGWRPASSPINMACGNELLRNRNYTAGLIRVHCRDDLCRVRSRGARRLQAVQSREHPAYTLCKVLSYSLIYVSAFVRGFVDTHLVWYYLL